MGWDYIYDKLGYIYIIIICIIYHIITIQWIIFYLLKTIAVLVTILVDHPMGADGIAIGTYLMGWWGIEASTIDVC